MSLTKSARRLSLLGGSSLSAVGLILAAGVLLAPHVASAAPNPCGTDPNTNGALADDITCPAPPTTYPTGIEHTSNGDLIVRVNPLSNLGTGGVVTTAGTLNDDLTVRFAGTATASTTAIATTAPIVLDTSSQAGDIVVDIAVARATSTSATLTANGATVTHFVKAISTAGGDVTVTRSTGTGQIQATGAAGVAAVEARSIGGGNVTVATSGTGSLSASGAQYGILTSVDGAGTLTINAFGSATGAAGIAGVQASSTGSGAISIAGSGSGRLYGIRAEAAGTGALTITAGGSANSGTGIAGIHATTATGLLTITASGSGGAGSGVVIDAGGDVMFTGGGTGALYGIDLLDVAANTTSTVNLTGASSGGLALLRAQGAGEVAVNITGRIGGDAGAVNTGMDFAGLANAPAVNFRTGSLWRLGATPVAFAASAEGLTLNIEEGASVVASMQIDAPIFNVDIEPQVMEPATVVTFTGDDTVVVNAGDILVGGRSPSAYLGTDINFANAFLKDRHEAELRFVGLGEFRHSGTILLGGYYLERTDRGTDGWHDDILSMPGAHWVGEGGEVVFDVDMAGPAQNDCDRSANGDLTSADCLMLVGGSTEGVTYVTVAEIVPGDRGAYNPDGFVLVDVSGGDSAQGHFVVGPNTPGYSPLFGGMMDKGLFASMIAYDAATQQHRLVSLPSGNALQLPGLAHSAHGLWRLATGSWFDRQADLRGAVESDGGGVWLRLSGESVERDLVQSVAGAGQSFDFDNSGVQTGYAVTGGLDLVRTSGQDGAFVLGVTAGYSHADVEYDPSPNTAILDGFTAGAYASYVSGPFFIDGAVNLNRAVLRYDAPGFRLFPTETILDTDFISVGGQVEAGWRFALEGGVFVEPLAGVSYVRTGFDDLYVAPGDASRMGVSAEFEDPSSLRAGLGGRLGWDEDFGWARTQLSVMGRVWNEFEGETTVLLHSPGPDVQVADDLSGRFNELALGANLYSPTGVVSGFLNLGGRFADDYQAKTASAGIRVAW